MPKLLAIVLIISSIAAVGCGDPFAGDPDPGDPPQGFLVAHEPLDVDCISREVYSTTDNYIIRDPSDYEALFEPSPRERCDEYAPPAVNFDENVLLGQYASGGCEVEFFQQVVRDDDAREVIFTVEVSSEGDCEKLEFSFNWLTVPAFPEDYEVIFEVEDE